MSEELGMECSKTADASLCLSFAFHLSFFPSQLNFQLHPVGRSVELPATSSSPTPVD